MSRFSVRRTLTMIVALATVAAFAAATPAVANGSTQVPRWLLHVQNFPGGISAGVRAMADPATVHAQATVSRTATTASTATFGPNVQMNTDSNPPLPQNETAVAASLDNPKVAVAAANDYVSGGNVVMRTLDGGLHWSPTR